MKYDEFTKIFNEIIFEKSKVVLLDKISKNPNRFIGLFRPTKPKAKLLQNLLQSHEIKFGDAFETLITQYIAECGYQNLEKNITYFDGTNIKTLNLDQFFLQSNKYYIAEEKVRDDHDSSKKEGQMANFEKKVNALREKYGESNLIATMHFIDPELKKNRNYYTKKLSDISKAYGIETHLFYGEEFFNFLGMKGVWSQILGYLEDWKYTIKDIPEINFDLEPPKSFEEIKDLEPRVFRKLFSNEVIFNEIVLTLFPQKKTLELLLNHFNNLSSQTIYKTLSQLLEKRLASST